MSNYDEVIKSWQNQFITWDHKAQMENLGYQTMDDTNLYLTYLTEPYVINRKTGEIVNQENSEHCLTFTEIMALYHILWYAKKNPRPSGNWVPFRDLKRAGGFDQALQQQTLAPTVAKLTGKLDALKQVAIQKGFPLLSHGDISFLIELFPNLFLKVIFWDADEEFPAKLTLLFDENIIDYTHEETVIMMVWDVCQLLTENL